MSTQEEITIAKAALAGWKMRPVGGANYTQYEAVGPDGQVYGYRSTRYTAALMALDYINNTRPWNRANAVAS